MAITTYALLQTAVANWLDKDNLTDRIPEFIELFEARANRVGLLRTMEVEVDLTLTINLDYVALPTGFLSPIAAWMEIDNKRRPLILRLPQQFNVSDVVSIPKLYAIDGVNVQFDCLAAAAYTVPMRYLKSFALSALTTTNELLQKGPDAYLFGSLAEAAPYLRDDSRISMWESKANRAIAELRNLANRSRAITLTNENAGRRANIFEG